MKFVSYSLLINLAKAHFEGKLVEKDAKIKTLEDKVKSLNEKLDASKILLQKYNYTCDKNTIYHF